MGIKITKYKKVKNELALEKYLNIKDKDNARRKDSRRANTSTSTK